MRTIDPLPALPSRHRLRLLSKTRKKEDEGLQKFTFEPSSGSSVSS